MREYYVEYRQFFDDEEVFESLMYFMADDSDHALEQCEDALQSEQSDYELLGVGVN